MNSSIDDLVSSSQLEKLYALLLKQPVQYLGNGIVLDQRTGRYSQKDSSRDYRDSYTVEVYT